MKKVIRFDFTARYEVSGSIDVNTKKVWFVLHGYGQLAEYFLRKFKSLEEKGIYVIAPEGLSRFYIEDVTKRSQGGSQRVGATWMTRENRLVDIENYLTYLNTIYQQEIADRKDLDITVLGFSQGAATASRWVLENQIQFNRLLLWAGMFPDDMDFAKGHEVLLNKKIQLVYGKQDPFLNDERLVHMETLTQKLNVPAEVITFDGGHEIDDATLERLV
ncbi:phospholipase [Chryseotalea sanaruensis]|uniref:Phospholipase n=1 Tax=Chryseotalea sanaruensis TaxID=2482724 RepID=A0A401U5K7_9BACT|nr:alpha/beta hydrolase [Chryseotalea sanaruensis]GCC50165.1 phospholipase [Chryseotalea sanaruensis]